VVASGGPVVAQWWPVVAQWWPVVAQWWPSGGPVVAQWWPSGNGQKVSNFDQILMQKKWSKKSVSEGSNLGCFWGPPSVFTRIGNPISENAFWARFAICQKTVKFASKFDPNLIKI